MDSIFNRRSVRSFLDKEVEKEKVEKILRAGMQAPSAGNGQPWEFIVVKGKANLESLANFSPYANTLKGAGFGIVVMANSGRSKYPEYWQQDLGAATQNILLQVTELELGAVWYGVAPEKERMEYISNLYRLDKKFMPFSVIGIGYPENANANHFIDRFDPSRLHYIG